ncbi:MAG: WD40 repeat domain-containing protein [Planctomycetota bacterium]|nr:WD40 repeat domain-containing protein [Planctomycetota bacterium]
MPVAVRYLTATCLGLAFILFLLCEAAAEKNEPPFSFRAEVSLPSGEAITEAPKVADTTDDSHYTLFVSKKGNVRLYQTYPLRTVRKMGNVQGARLAAVSRKGKYAIIVGDSSIRAWALSYEARELEPLTVETAGIESVDVSDGGIAAIASTRSTLLFDLKKGEAIATPKIYSSACKIRAKRAVFGTSDGQALILDCENGATLKAVRFGMDKVTGVDITPDGKMAVAAVQRKNTVFVFDTETGDTLHELKPEGVDFFPGKPVLRDCAISMNGKYVAASYNKKFLIYDLIFKQLVGFAETVRDFQGRIRLVGDKPTLFCSQTVAFWEYKPGKYNGFTNKPTLSLTEASKKTKGVREIVYSAGEDRFYLFMLNGKLMELNPSRNRKKELGTVPAKGKPALSPRANKLAFAFERAIWLYSTRRLTSHKVIETGPFDEFGFVSETRLYVRSGKKLTFYNTRGHDLASCDIPFEPHGSFPGEGAAYAYDNSGRWLVSELPDGTAKTGTLALDGARIAGTTRAGILTLRGLEGKLFREPFQTPVFSVPLARSVGDFAVDSRCEYIAYTSASGAYLREVETGGRWRLPEAADYPEAVFSDNRRMLYFFSKGGVTVFRR